MLEAKELADVIRQVVKREVDAARAAMLVEFEARIAALPMPKDGIAGKDGAHGATGKDGAAGVAGKDGAPGKDGDAGVAGPQGQVGVIGESGLDGVNGKDGANGNDGIDGKDGAPGRDALQVEILPAIDESKSYTRGTFAKHRGGLWRAFESTAQMRGWECIVEGVDAAGFKDSEDPRAAEFVLTLSSGAEVAKVFRFPSTMYRGVFREGDEYARGDMATWGGSLWHCDKSTTDKPGEPGSKGWTCAAKRGRDGRDGANGKDATLPVVRGA